MEEGGWAECGERRPEGLQKEEVSGRRQCSVHFAGHLQPCDLALAPGLRSGRGSQSPPPRSFPIPAKTTAGFQLTSAQASVLFSLLCSLWSVWQQGPRFESHTLVAPLCPPLLDYPETLSPACPLVLPGGVKCFCFDVKPCPWLIPSRTVILDFLFVCFCI